MPNWKQDESVIDLHFRGFKTEKVEHGNGAYSVYMIGVVPQNGKMERRYLVEQVYG